MISSTDNDLIPEMADLVRRMEIRPLLLKRMLEEEITQLVAIPDEDKELRESEKLLLGENDRQSWLNEKNWKSFDLDLHLRRPLALKRFAIQQFGPGIEELFMETQGSRDEVIYSLLRVKNSGLSWEIYMRLAEGEITFPNAASDFGEGPEAHRNGVIGPMGLGQLHPPLLRDLLRSLKPGDIHPPQKLGEWFVILRLERMKPARLDNDMRQTLLDEQLDIFLTKRVEKILAGEKPEKLIYHQERQP